MMYVLVIIALIAAGAAALLAIGFILAGAAGDGAGRLLRWWRMRRFEPHRCTVCHYDLTGVFTGRCPECGAIFTYREEEHGPRDGAVVVAASEGSHSGDGKKPSDRRDWVFDVVWMLCALGVPLLLSIALAIWLGIRWGSVWVGVLIVPVAIFPLMFLGGLLGILAAKTVSIFAGDRRWEALSYECNRCRYDLRGIVGGVCPECGINVAVHPEEETAS